MSLNYCCLCDKVCEASMCGWRRARARGLLVVGLSRVGPCDSDWSKSRRLGSKTVCRMSFWVVSLVSLHLIMWNTGYDRCSHPSAWRREASYWTCTVFSFGCVGVPTGYAGEDGLFKSTPVGIPGIGDWTSAVVWKEKGFLWLLHQVLLWVSQKSLELQGYGRA